MSEILKTAHPAEEREKALTLLYKSSFPMVAKFISKRGGTFEQAKDIFHDALVIWYERSADEGQGKITLSVKAYLFGIAKHLWYRSFSETKTDSLPEGLQYGLAEEPAEESLSSDKLLDLIERAGKKCMEMLKAFYYDKLSVTELAAGFGFRSVHSAAVQKYKCLEKIRETVKEKSLCYEDFFE